MTYGTPNSNIFGYWLWDQLIITRLFNECHQHCGQLNSTNLPYLGQFISARATKNNITFYYSTHCNTAQILKFIVMTICNVVCWEENDKIKIVSGFPVIKLYFHNVLNNNYNNNIIPHVLDVVEYPNFNQLSPWPHRLYIRQYSVQFHRITTSLK